MNTDIGYQLKELERVSRKVSLHSQRTVDPAKRWVCKVSIRVAGVKPNHYADIPYYGGTPEAAVNRAYVSKFM